MSESDGSLRVLVVTTVHTPLDARIHHRQIRAMRQAGWSVTYAAPFRATETSEQDLVSGTVAVDVPRAVGRRRLRALLAARALIKRSLHDHDVVLLHDPELFLAVIGRLRRVPIVLDVHEDLAASVRERTYLPRWTRGVIARVVRQVERWLERHVSILLAEGQYQKRFARPHAVVRNLPWSRRPDPDARIRPRVIYIGRLSLQRGVHEMIEVGRRLAEADGPEVVLIGPADAEVAQPLDVAVEAGFVSWQRFVPNDLALAEAQGSLAGLSLLHDTPNYRVSLPTKVLECLSCGVPVITTPLPEAVQVIESSGAGVVVPFGSVDEVVRVIERWADEPELRQALGTQAVEASRDRTWDAEIPVFLTALRDVAGA